MDTESSDGLRAAERELFAVPPEQFLTLRTTLSAAAKGKGDFDTARRIAALRKPTLAAWIVNAYVIAEPAAVSRLTSLGTTLRQAQDTLQASRLRELAARRRELVRELTAAALAAVDRADPPSSLRDDVSGTFEAALADEQVAAQLGCLQRAARWSGFGFSGEAVPQLTLVRGGRPDASEARRASPVARSRGAETPSSRAQHDADERARQSLARLGHELDDSALAEREAVKLASRAREELDRARQASDDANATLGAAKRADAQARQQAAAARRRREVAQRRLDRARPE